MLRLNGDGEDVATVGSLERPKAKYREDVHRLRGVAILSVVSWHVVSVLGIPMTGITRAVFDTTVVAGTSIFLMISGFLFRETMSTYRYGRFLKRKARNVLAPYLVVSTPAIAIYVLDLKQDHPWLEPEFFDRSVVEQVLFFVVSGAHLGPLWFMPMILAIFLLAPLWVMLERRPILYLVLPALVLLSIAVPRPEDDNNVLQSAVHFAAIFVLGMFLSRHHKALMTTCRRHPARFIAIAVLAVGFGVFASLAVPSMTTTSRAAFGVFVLVALNSWAGSGVAASCLDRLAVVSFPVYFIHGYPIALLRAVAPETSARPLWQWVLSWITLTLLVTVCSAAAGQLIHKVLGRRSRYVIGM